MTPLVLGVILLVVFFLSVMMPLFFFLAHERFKSNRVETIKLVDSIKFICLERSTPRGGALFSENKNDDLFLILSGSELLGENRIISIPRLFRTFDSKSDKFWKRKIKEVASEGERNRLIFRANSSLYEQDENAFQVGIYYFVHITPTERIERFVLTDLLLSSEEKLLKNEYQR